MLKKTKILLISVAMLIMGSAALHANPLEYKNAIGIYGMFGFSNSGLQYQRWFNDRIGLQSQVLAWYESGRNQYDDPEYEFALNTQLLFSLFKTNFGEKAGTNLYAWGLLGYYLYNTTDYVDGSSLGVYSIRITESICNNFVFGAGFGFDVMFWDHLSVPFEFGFAGQMPHETRISLTAATGIRYRF